MLRYFGDIPAGVHLVMDGRMVFASVALIVVAMLGFGMAPAIQAVRSSRSPGRMRLVLVGVQLTASVSLLILAMLLAHSDARQRAFELAFDYPRTIVVDPQFGARTLTPAAQWARLDDMTTF